MDKLFNIRADKWNQKIRPLFEQAIGTDGATVLKVVEKPDSKLSAVYLSSEPNAMQSGLLEGLAVSGSLGTIMEYNVIEAAIPGSVNEHAVAVAALNRA